ncbi:MAG: YbhN family protein [Sandaracinaceae bacterium]
MSKPSPARRWLVLAKVAVSLGLCAWLAVKVQRQDGLGSLLERLDRIEVGWIAVAVALHFLAVFAGVARWRLLLRVSGIELGAGRLTRAFLIGRFIGAFTPSTSGLDGYRLLAAGRASGKMTESAAAIGVEKLVGLIGMASVCAVLVPFGGASILGPSAVWTALAIGGGAALLLVLLRHPSWLGLLVTRAPRTIRGKLGKAQAALHELDLGAGSMARAVGLGVISHLALSAVFAASARALGVDVSVAALLVVGNAIVIAVLLPVSIGGIGVRESVAVGLLSAIAVPPGDALLVALLTYLTGQVPALLGAVFMMAERHPPVARVPARSSDPLASSA